MLRRRTPDYPYFRLKDWADSGDSLSLRCEACAAEASLRPATLIARHGWHGIFAKAVDGLACPECGGATEIVRHKLRGVKEAVRLPASSLLRRPGCAA